jgi:hypothetical protein
MYKNLINVAPRFSRHKLYFNELQKSFHKWNRQVLKEITKHYGKNRVRKVLSGEFPPSEEIEKADMEKLKGKELDKYKNEGIESLMCLFDLQIGADHHIAFYYSFFIYLFSDFENKINIICRDYIEKNDLRVDLKDLKGSGIERSLLFLKKIAEVRLPDSALINEIILMRDIRNCLAHSEGYTSDNHIIKHVKNLKHIAVKGRDNGEEDRIFFAKEYPKYCINQMERFFDQLAKNNPRVFDRLFK